MSSKPELLTDPIYQYLLTHSLREPKILEALRQETASLANAKAQISPETGQFLSLLVELLQVENILEIGCFTGYSALVMALKLPTAGQLLTCDVNQAWTDIAKAFWQKAGVYDKIALHLAPAVETLTELVAKGRQNSFDLAFIDADKASYEQYYEYCLQLVRPGGLIILDNMLWYGKVADPKVNDRATQMIRQVNNKIHQDTRVSMSLIAVGDGLCLARKL